MKVTKRKYTSCLVGITAKLNEIAVTAKPPFLVSKEITSLKKKQYQPPTMDYKTY